MGEFDGYNEADKTGGEKTHTLTKEQMPIHNHTEDNDGNHRHGLYTSYGDCLDAAHGLLYHDNDIDYVNVIAAAWLPNIIEANKGTDYYEHIWNNNSKDNSTRYSMNEKGDHSHTIHDSGSGKSHNNLQPYITCDMWKRTN